MMSKCSDHFSVDLAGSIRDLDNGTVFESYNCSTDRIQSAGQPGLPFDLISFIIYSVVMAVGLAGNSLVIYVVLRFSRMQTVTNYYIVNLAVTDELFLNSIWFVLITMWLNRWPFGAIGCKLYWTITSANQFTSSLLLTVMSADRYLAVCHPIDSNQWRTLSMARLVCAGAWTLSALMVIPLPLFADDQNGKCNIYWPLLVAGFNGPALFTLYTFVVTFALPAVAVIFFYSCVLLKLRRSNTATRSSAGAGQQCSNNHNPAAPAQAAAATAVVVETTAAVAEVVTAVGVATETAEQRVSTMQPIKRRREQRRRKVTRLVAALIVVYFCCYLPFWLTQLSLLAQEGTLTVIDANVSAHVQLGPPANVSGADSENQSQVEPMVSASPHPSPTPAPEQRHSPSIKFVFMLAFVLTYCNSAVNPVLYAFLSENFKMLFQSVYNRRRRQTVNNVMLAERSANPAGNILRHLTRTSGVSANPVSACASAGQRHGASSVQLHVHQNGSDTVTTTLTTTVCDSPKVVSGRRNTNPTSAV